MTKSERAAGLRLLVSALVLLPAALGAAAPGTAAPSTPSTAPAPCPASIPELYDLASRAVVSVTATAVNTSDLADRLTRQGGSGVIFDAAGLVVTNSHVVFGRQAISVTLDDGTILPARTVGIDPILDVAVLRIPTPPEGKLPAAVFGDASKLRVGDEVFAIGNPFGLEQTLTRGIVSAINRILPGVSWSLREPLIQTDAAINHGNSGGPLVDRCGRVIGLNTAILPDAQGIGFAIPIDLVRKVLPELVEKGRVIRPWLGVQGQIIAPALREVFRIPPVEGLLVEVVEPGSPTEGAGLRGGDLDVVVSGNPLLLGGDIVTAINGVPLSTPSALAEVIAGFKVGGRATLDVRRGSESLHFEVVVAERPILPQDVSTGRAATPAASGSRPGPLFSAGRQRL